MFRSVAWALATLLLLSACEINDRGELDTDAAIDVDRDSGLPAGDGSVSAADASGLGSDSGTATPPDASAASGLDAGTVAAAPRIIGRYDDGDPAGPRFGFSGSAIEARFSGTGITLKLADSDSDIYTVLVDGTKSTVSTLASQQSYPLASGLAAGDHHVLVWKNTEWFQGTGQFLGFDLAGGGAYLPLSPPARRLEFVGDSITCAYGNVGAGPSCGFSSETEDHYLGYAALTARALGADQSTVCQSGIGIFRNYGGETDGTMPDLYPLAHGGGPAWDFSRFVPDAVLVNLGTNDFAMGPPDKASFQTAYRGFLDTIRSKYPDAFILLAVGPMLGTSEAATAKVWLDELAAARGAAGDAKVSVVEFTPQDGNLGYGCDWHPSAATHQQMADHLAPILKGLLGW
ncbi:MAG TPA: SGNH/GDSL hydrolase family protein [Myxococcales bacterium]|jgi:lysophospholipase L1-like esterase